MGTSVGVHLAFRLATRTVNDWLPGMRQPMLYLLQRAVPQLVSAGSGITPTGVAVTANNETDACSIGRAIEPAPTSSKGSMKGSI